MKAAGYIYVWGSNWKWLWIIWVLITLLPSEFSRQAALLPVLPGLAFGLECLSLPHWTSPYPPISQGPSPAPLLQKPSRRTLGPKHTPGNTFQGGKQFYWESQLRNISVGGWLNQSLVWSLFSSLMGATWAPPQMPSEQLCPCLPQAQFPPPLPLSTAQISFWEENFFFSQNDSILVAAVTPDTPELPVHIKCCIKMMIGGVRCLKLRS